MNINHSIFIAKILKLLKIINEYYKNSIFLKVMDKVYKLFLNSYILDNIVRKLKNSNFKNYREGSFIISKLIKFLDNSIIFLKKLYKKYFYNKYKNCFFNYILNISVDKLKIIFISLAILIGILSFFIKSKLIIIFVLLPIFLLFSFFNTSLSFILFIFIVSCIPHNLWNNIYIFFASILYMFIYNINYFNDKFQKIDTDYLYASLIIYILFCVISIFTGFGSMDSLRVFLILFSCILFSILVTNIINTLDLYKKFIYFIFMAIFITSLYGLYQFNRGIEVKLEFVDIQKNSYLPGRLYSTMGNPNNYAEFLIMLLPFCVSYIFTIKDNIKKIIFILLLVPCFLALALTFSRASYLSLIGSIIVYILIINPKSIPIGIIFFILLIPFIPKTIIMRLSTIGKDSSSMYRIFIWEGVLRLIKNYWIQGIGIGPEAFKLIYKVYSHELAGPAMHSHNVFLNTWVEIGIGGFISLVVYIYQTFKNLLSNFLNAKNKDIKYFSIASISSLTGSMLFSLVEHTWFYPRIMLTFWITIGLSFAIIKINRSTI